MDVLHFILGHENHNSDRDQGRRKAKACLLLCPIRGENVSVTYVILGQMDFKNVVIHFYVLCGTLLLERAIKSFTYSTGHMPVFSGLHLTSKSVNTVKTRDWTENDFPDR